MNLSELSEFDAYGKNREPDAKYFTRYKID